jgi:hypothetical protein
MPTQPPNTPSAANLTGTVLDNLLPGSPLQPQISAALNAALNGRRDHQASRALVGLINTIPAADLVAAKDLSLQAFAQQQIDPMANGGVEKLERGLARRGAFQRLRKIGPALAHERECFEPLLEGQPLHHRGPSTFTSR